MPWTASNTINSIKKKPLELRQLFAEVANAVLADGGSEEEAIQAGLSAVSKKEGKVRVKKAVMQPTQPEIPSHLAAILALKAKRQAEQPETFIEKATRATKTALETVSEEIDTTVLFKQTNRLEPDSERSLVGVDWDSKDRLVLQFDDGEKLVSDPAPARNVSQSSVAVINNLEPLFRMKEPTGFTSRTDNVISFDESTRTFTIQALTEKPFEVWLHAVSTQHTEDSIVIPDVSGIHIIYYDYLNASLKCTQSTSPELFTDFALVAIIYWRQDQQKAIYFADERHGIVMDGITHRYLHTAVGAQYRLGLGLYDFVVDDNGSSDLQCKFSCQNGVIEDEDLEFTILNNNPQQLQSYCTLPVFYRVGSDAIANWYSKTAQDIPLIKAGDVTHFTGARVAYNTQVAGVWSLAEVPDNHFVLVHVLATNDVNYPIVALLGGEYQNKAAAREGANNEMRNIAGLPFLEFVELGTVIYQTNSAYTNSYSSRIVSTDTGSNYVDYRITITSVF